MHIKLRDLNIDIAAQGGRNIEVLASGLPCYGGARLAIDAALRGGLAKDGKARPQA